MQFSGARLMAKGNNKIEPLMLRLRCDVAKSAMSVKLTCEVAVASGARRWATFRPIGPYGLTIGLDSASPMNRCWRPHSGSTLYSSTSPIVSSRRYVRVAGAKKQAEPENNTTNEGDQQQQNQQEQASDPNSNTTGAGPEGAEGAEKKKEGRGLFSIFSQIKHDMVQFPDIYNSINLLNFILFTVFCLCSTGSNVETEWWMEHWGIDAAFRPWAWALHSLLTNNFLSMAFAMMMIHGMCTSAVASVGSAGLMQYLAIVSIVSGVIIWAFNYGRGYTKEKQFGPWDITAALFVLQYLHQGFTPWQILNSFSGWQKYAMWVGAFCIMYYDWQPVICGTALGLALIKLHPKFRAPLAAAA